ncbi:MAG: host attachment protein [Acetobacter sp.]|jgi:hypothetical protein|nr:host attachment protein [Acetobacter sp.]MCH4059944.1 host attachment protein [Acetobacter sp.]MCH4086885.1 host attachment protein [Acetobacter sp.]MCI1294295.1 host attachment protein [Acetobacter sp.]MCI1320945.1 host attachment protein [Acetobacter sp.]
MSAQDGEVIYVVADGGHARLLRHEAHGLVAFETLEAGKLSLPPGVMPRGATPADRAKDGFARGVADRLNDLSSHHHPLQGFVLAAPATALHEIREHLSKVAAEKIIKTFTKDLVGIPDHELLEHFDVPATGWNVTP